MKNVVKTKNAAIEFRQEQNFILLWKFKTMSSLLSDYIDTDADNFGGQKTIGFWGGFNLLAVRDPYVHPSYHVMH